MKEKDGPAPGQGETPVDPSLWRGLTQSRLSRRQVLASAGTGAGALGLSAFLAACGVKGTAAPAGSASPAGGVGTAAWWAKQKLHHTVNFANWPYYIDVLNGKHPTLEHFTQTTGIKVNYTEPISDNVAFYAKIRPSLAAKQYTGFDIIVMTDSTPNALGYLMQIRLADPARPVDDDQLPQVRQHAGEEPSLGPGQQVHDGLAVGLHRDRLQLLGDQEPAAAAWTSCSTRSTPGKVGMMSDPQELGSVGLLAIGIDPATSTESDWAKAAKKLQQQKSDGIVRAYYDQSYIGHLKNGDTVVTQAWSGDIFQADLNSKYARPQAPDPRAGR